MMLIYVIHRKRGEVDIILSKPFHYFIIPEFNSNFSTIQVCKNFPQNAEIRNLIDKIDYKLLSTHIANSSIGQYTVSRMYIWVILVPLVYPSITL